jgi:hypothetical protein
VSDWNGHVPEETAGVVMTADIRAAIRNGTHDCSDCFQNGGIGFLCGHPAGLANDCTWCQEKGLKPGDQLPVPRVLRGDPWPETDAELVEHARQRMGLTLTDPEGYVQRKRDEHAAGLPYYAPTTQEIATTAQWDEVYRARAARGELTGTILDGPIVAARDAEREAEREAWRRQTRGWPNLKACLKYPPTLILFLLAAAWAVLALVGVISG